MKLYLNIVRRMNEVACELMLPSRQLKVGIPSCLMPHSYVNIHGKGVGCVCRLHYVLIMHRGCTAEGSVVYRDIILTRRSSFSFTFGCLAPGKL